jgi:hypothetical protein
MLYVVVMVCSCDYVGHHIVSDSHLRSNFHESVFSHDMSKKHWNDKILLENLFLLGVVSKESYLFAVHCKKHCPLQSCELCASSI